MKTASADKVLAYNRLAYNRLANNGLANNRFATCQHKTRLLTGLLVFVGLPALLWAEDSVLQQRRREQQATVDVARQLIADVLDIQIEQFTENGLDRLPVFADIQRMRDNIGHVTDEDMRQIIELLNQAQQAANRRQTELTSQARDKARQVVTVLMAERERLRQRMKVARAQAQLQQLIDQQQRVRSDTQQLYTTPSSERDRANLAALEDQRDTHTLFDELTRSLQTIQQFDSKESRAAADSMEQLRKEGVEPMLNAAESALAKGNIDAAQQKQADIVNRLSAVLDKMAAAQGLQARDPSTSLEKVQNLRREQQHLMDDTRAIASDDQSKFDQLSQRQKDIQDRLGELESSDTATADGAPLLRQAKTAAMQAEEELFRGDRQTALDQQQEVVRNLSQLEDLLETAKSMPPSTQDGDLSQLEQLSQQLDKLAEQQDQVIANADSAPQKAEQLQQDVADGLAEQTDRAPEAEGVQQAVQAAADKAKQAAGTMQNASPQSSAARSKAAAGVQKAIETAQARTAAQLQAARNAMQQPNAQSMAKATPGKRGQPSAVDAQQSVNGGARRGKPSRPSSSEQTAPQATSSQRTVADGQRTSDQRDAIAGRSYANAPWFARLPPELREAIRMRGRRQSPRGYEERLRRYFESVDK